MWRKSQAKNSDVLARANVDGGKCRLVRLYDSNPRGGKQLPYYSIECSLDGTKPWRKVVHSLVSPVDAKEKFQQKRRTLAREHQSVFD